MGEILRSLRLNPLANYQDLLVISVCPRNPLFLLDLRDFSQTFNFRLFSPNQVEAPILCELQRADDRGEGKIQRSADSQMFRFPVERLVSQLVKKTHRASPQPLSTFSRLELHAVIHHLLRSRQSILAPAVCTQ